MAVPSIATSGAKAEGSGTSLSVPYPSGISSGDLLILLYCNGSRNGNFTDPTDWTREFAIGGGSGGTECLTGCLSKIADGTETGNLTFGGLTNNESHLARMHRITGGDTLEDKDWTRDSSKTIGHADITTTGTDRLVMVVTGISDDETASNFTGETGGDLTIHSQDGTILDDDAHLSLQTVGLATAGTISGGTWTYSGATEGWSTISFAVYQDTVTNVGSSAGTSAVDGQSGFKASSTGTSTANATAGFVASASGTSTAAAQSGSQASSAGASTISGASGSTGSSVGSATVTGIPTTQPSVGTSAGTSTVTGFSGSLASSSGVAATAAQSGSFGTSAGASTAQSYSGSLGALSGTSTVAALSGSVAASIGTSTIAGLSGSQGSAAGTSTVTGQSPSVYEGTGTAAGTSTVTGLSGSSGASAGSSTLMILSGSTGLSAGIANVIGVGIQVGTWTPKTDVTVESWNEKNETASTTWIEKDMSEAA
jgi:hypothetical protein